MTDISRPLYLSRIVPFLDKPLIKVLTGMRRVGKSSLVRLLIHYLLGKGTPESRIIYINKESMEWDFIRDDAELYRYVTGRIHDSPGKPYLFIDEVQEIANWERVVNSLLADDRADITITGSNAGLLSSELATLIAGRYVEVPVFPLSYREFLDFRGAAGNDSPAEFRRYLRYGGLPGIHTLELIDEMVFPYLNALYNTIVLKDVVSRNRVQDPDQLDRIVRFIFDNAGNITTAKRIADFLKNQKISAGVDKVMHYLSCLEQAFLIRRVLRYDIKGLRHLELYEKYYSGDVGLRHGFLGYRDGDISGMLENVVYLELLRRGHRVSIGKLDDREIDFVAEKQDGRIYIQVCLTLESPETLEREFSALERIPDNHPKLVLSLDEYQRVKRGGIMHGNLRDWLTQG
ncbi:MAG TPA: ATPase [Treponema sp.]|nr:MAG: ATPase [Treponema sp. GWC1_61_84]OHE76683.1 MAG: ATPase [Treponema sp. RIFOXYC1_FULL_61_9]HCM29155.1 ATPase [Treponema sp.]